MIAAALLLSACRTGRNYPETDAPRHAGGEPTRTACGSPCTFRVVSFNIAFSRNIDDAIELLRSDSSLNGADVLLLQEMDAEGTGKIADALGMSYVYYPAIFHRLTRRDFGNAVLSRWPIVDDDRLTLPHSSRYAGTRRIAAAATVRVDGRRIRVYSTHLGTPADITSRDRRAQLAAIIEDAECCELAIIGGDMNDETTGQFAESAGYLWLTQTGPRTARGGRLDHIFLKGMRRALGAGTVTQSRGVSDHHPVWAAVTFD